MSNNDIRILRDYLLGGGMLIADAGHRDFGRSFEHLMTRVFPDNRLREVALDDTIFLLPYEFPNGAPPLWSHYGTRMRGIRHEGRWVVLFHPGDLNDAWKDPDFADVDDEVREAALNLGINLLYYALTQWNEAVQG